MTKEMGPRLLRVSHQILNSRSRNKSLFPEKCDIGILYCHLLLHDTMLHDDSHVLVQLIVLFVNVVLKENLLNIFYYVVSDFKMPEIR